jgi:hypothetical protein
MLFLLLERFYIFIYIKCKIIYHFRLKLLTLNDLIRAELMLFTEFLLRGIILLFTFKSIIPDFFIEFETSSSFDEIEIYSNSSG